MRKQGKILNVVTTNVGAFLSQDESAGSYELHVNNAYTFNTDGGTGAIVATGEVFTYSGYDLETNVIQLDSTTPLLASASEGFKVEVRPVAIERRAYVDTLDGFEPIPTQVPYTMQIQLPDGIRTEETGYESVSIERDGTDWVLKEIYGTPATIIFDSISVQASAISDNKPPVFAPSVIATPFAVGAIQLDWAAVPNADPIMYDVYASYAQPVVLDGSTYVGTTSSTRMTISVLGGVQLSFTSAVYAVVVPRDNDGVGPTSNQVSALARKADNDYISTNYLYAGDIEANKILSGSLGVDAVFQVGDFIEIDGINSTITVYSDAGHINPVIIIGPNNSMFTGTVTSELFTVLENLRIQGTMSAIANNSSLTLADGVADPSVAPEWNYAPLKTTTPAIPTGYTLNGYCGHPTAGYVTRLLYKSADKLGYTQVINTATGAQVGSITVLGNVPGFVEDNFSGIVYYSGYYFVGVMNYDEDSSDAVYIAKFNSTTNAYVSKYLAAYIPISSDRGTTFARLGIDYVNAEILITTSKPTSAIVRFNWSDLETGSLGEHFFYYSGDVSPNYQTPSFMGYGAVYDYGVPRWIAALGTSATVSSSSTGAAGFSLTGDAAWSGPSGARYFWHNVDGIFYMESGNILYKLAPYDPLTKFWVGYRDINGANNTGLSPKSSVDVPSRQYLTTTLSPLAVGTTSSEVYIGYGATSPAPSAMYKRPESLTGRSMFLVNGVDTSGVPHGKQSTVSNKALTSNVATLTTSVDHGYIIGQTVFVYGVDTTFNGTYTIVSVPTTTTFTYSKTAADVASTASSGTVLMISTTFSGGTPGTLISAVGGLILRGNGTASIPLLQELADTGVITTTTGNITAGTGWSIANFSIRKVGKVVSFKVEATRTGSAVTVPANGNIANQTVATLTSSWWPPMESQAHSGSTGVVSMGYVGTSGNIVISAVTSGASMATGETFSMGGNYTAADY